MSNTCYIENVLIKSESSILFYHHDHYFFSGSFHCNQRRLCFKQENPKISKVQESLIEIFLNVVWFLFFEKHFDL